MKTRNWTKLERTTPRAEPGQMRISLERHLVLSINRAAFLALRSPSSVEMFYDESGGLIGLVPADIGTQDGYAVRDRTKGQGKYVTMKRFCSRFGLNPGRTIVFRNPTFDPDGTLVLNYRQALADSAAGWGVAELQSEQPEREHPSRPVSIASGNDEWSNLRA